MQHLDLDLLRAMGHTDPREEQGREALRRENVRIQAQIDAEREAQRPPAALVWVCPQCHGWGVQDSCGTCCGAGVVTEAVWDAYRFAHGWDEAHPDHFPLAGFLLSLAAFTAFLCALDWAGHGKLACVVVSLAFLIAAWFVPGKGRRG